jgi:hypothetical protein
VRLIWCADGNLDHSRAAVSCGWSYGVRLPARGMLRDAPLYFADQDWKRPKRARYMGLLAEHRPALATVLDLESHDQLPEVLDWAEEAAPHVREAVIVVVKAAGAARKIPRKIGGKEVRLGYSVATSYGSTPVAPLEFFGRPAHLLGGSPQAQHSLWLRLRPWAVSLDGNMAKKMATKKCLFWTERKTEYGHWQPLGGHDGDGPLEAVTRSLTNVKAFWDSQGRRTWATSG